MTVTLRHPHTNHHHNTFRNIVVALIAVAVVVFAIRSVNNTQITATTTAADQIRPAIVDPTGLGAALSVTYDTSQIRPNIVDPTGLGAALSVTYDTSSLDS